MTTFLAHSLAPDICLPVVVIHLQNLRKNLHALSTSFKRWEGAGTQAADEIMGKAVAYQTVIHPSLPNGLRSGTARVLGTTAAAVKFRVDARGSKSNSEMNQELREHAFAKRRVRGDKYDRKIVYNYFHHEGCFRTSV